MVGRDNILFWVFLKSQNGSFLILCVMFSCVYAKEEEYLHFVPCMHFLFTWSHRSIVALECSQDKQHFVYLNVANMFFYPLHFLHAICGRPFNCRNI